MAEYAARNGFDTVVVVHACRPTSPDVREPTLDRFAAAGLMAMTMVGIA